MSREVTFRVSTLLADSPSFDDDPHAVVLYLLVAGWVAERGKPILLSKVHGYARTARYRRALEALLKLGAFVVDESCQPPRVDISHTFGICGRRLVWLSAPAEPDRSRNTRPIPLGLRFSILNRDGFRCAYCGATPATSELHIDHIVPRVAGGSNRPTNLITACVECNLGKSSNLLTEQQS